MQISVEIHDHKGVASSLVNIGTVYNYENNFDTALNYYQNALAIVEKIGDREEEAFLYCNIGNVYKNKGLIDKALMHFQKSLLIAKEINNKPTVAKVLGNIGNIYQVRNDNRALNYHLEALAVFNAIGDRQGGACELSNIGGKRREAGCLGNIGLIHKAKGNSVEAAKYYKRSLALFDEFNMVKGKEIVEHNLKTLKTGNNYLFSSD